MITVFLARAGVTTYCFRLSKRSSFMKLMRRYCLIRRVRFGSLIFLHNDTPINARRDSPASLGLEENAVIRTPLCPPGRDCCSCALFGFAADLLTHLSVSFVVLPSLDASESFRCCPYRIVF